MFCRNRVFRQILCGRCSGVSQPSCPKQRRRKSPATQLYPEVATRPFEGSEEGNGKRKKGHDPAMDGRQQFGIHPWEKTAHARKRVWDDPRVANGLK